MQGIFEQTISEIIGDIVVQLPIKQHSEMAKLHQELINTIREFSFLTKDGTIRIYLVIVRMGI